MNKLLSPTTTIKDSHPYYLMEILPYVLPRCRVLAGVISLAAALPGYAQSIEATGDVNPFPDSGAQVWNAGNSLVVGITNDGSLSIKDGGLVTSGDSYIGGGGGSSGTVTVTGWTADSLGYRRYSEWRVDSQLAVGGYKSVDGVPPGTGGIGVLRVENGGKVFSRKGYVGIWNTSGAATVTGIGSLWSVSEELHIGGDLDNNEHAVGSGALTIADRGKVSSAQGVIGGGINAVNSSGIVTVTGMGSKWEIQNNLYIGRGRFSSGSGGNGALVISDGGLVTNRDAYIASSSATSSSVTVSGTGAKWVVDGTLNIEGRNSTLTIADGGTADIQAVSFRWLPYDAPKSITLDRGTLKTGDIDLGHLNFLSGTLVSRGRISGSLSDVGYGTIIPNDGHVVLSGRDAEWRISSDAVIGNAGGSSSLTIENGAAVVANMGITIGSGAGSTGLVTVTGDKDGSPYRYGIGTNELYIGWYDRNSYDWEPTGGTGTLTISDGGKVDSRRAYIGGGTDALGIVTVTGDGSEWNAGEIWIGSNWEGHSGGTGVLLVTEGGKVYQNMYDDSYSGYFIGNSNKSTGTVIVTGEGSEITGGDMVIGAGYGSTGTLTISDGGAVFSTSASIGGEIGSTGMASVSGRDASGNASSWHLSHRLYVGGESTGNLSITNGGQVTVGLDSYVSGNNGMVMVTGSGSRWESGNIYVGASDYNYPGKGTVQIQDGAVVSGEDITIAGGEQSVGTISIIGADSRLEARNINVGSRDIYFTYHGGVGTLTVEDGATVTIEESMSVGRNGVVNIQVSGRGGVSVGDWIYNDGLIRLIAAPNLAAGEYTPLVAGNGYHPASFGNEKSFGGVFDYRRQVFIVSETQNASAGGESIIDLEQAQRLEITGEHSQIMVAFDAKAQSVSGDSTISFTATENTVGFIDGEQVLSAWNFTTDIDYAYATMLCFSIGEGWMSDMLTIWHSMDGISWVALDIERLYDGDTITFSVDGFSSYAITAVPEPATYAAILSLLVIGLALRMKRRNRMK